MKTLVVIFSVIGLLTLNSCKQETDVQALMENAETRSEVLSIITENHKFMTEFMEQMHVSEHAMQMMQGNKNMMGTMMKGQGMQMMMKDSMITNNMMHSMMKDKNMMGNMMKMMHDKGMMSEDCMKSCMNMMGNKGMNMNHDEDKDSDTSHNH